MVTELFREWSEAAPLTEAPRETAGIAGVAAGLPFTGEDEEPFAFCAGEADEPTTTGG